MTGLAAGSQGKAGIKAVALDALTVFDPGSISPLVERLFPGRGAELSLAWRVRQFEYTWLRASAHRYADFQKVTEQALVYAAAALKIELTAAHRDRLLDGFLHLKAYADVPAALRSMKAAGLALGFLSNMTREMIDALVRNSKLENLVDLVLSTDKVRTYKPDPRAYQMGIDAFRLPKQKIVFGAFGGWDAAGAKLFGYPTFWVNPLGLPVEELDAPPDAIGSNLTDLATFATARG
jgi:2-haloacid dehalogenase